MDVLYNEFEPYAADWLRNLVAADLIERGDVDGRDIKQLRHDADTVQALRDARQAHFFAGIGIWSYALRVAGWPSALPVWTGSCPCQPWSDAGDGAGFDDPRHVWPDWFDLIGECAPPVILGEQVASPAALEWFDVVSTNLAGQGYAVGAADLCAASVGAPHIRPRLFFVALRVGDPRLAAGRLGDPNRPRLEERAGVRCDDASEFSSVERTGRESSGLDVTDEERLGRERLRLQPGGSRQKGHEAPGTGQAGDVADSSQLRRQDGDRGQGCGVQALELERPGAARSLVNLEASRQDDGRPGRGRRILAGDGPTRGFWGGAEWLYCRDDKWRAVEPGTFPLADGSSGRVPVRRPDGWPEASNEEEAPEVRYVNRNRALAAIGNSIVAPLAIEFIGSVLDVIGEMT